MNSESDLTDHFLDLDLDVDIRIQEIHSLKAIFPHTLTISDEFSGSIEIPIEVDSDIEVTSTNASKDSNARILNKSLSKFVKNLPPINLLFSLPESYPENEPPVFRVESQIISKDQISQLSTELLELWATYKDQVLFSMVDHIQERLISLTPARIDCQLDLAKFDSIITFNSSALLSQFNSQTYTCQICQEDYKGSHCSQFPSTCKHIFCNNCLYDYFSSLILTGEISKVHCPDYECTKAHIKTREKYLRVENLDISTFDFNDFKKNIMTPPISIDFLGKILIKETENPATTTSSESASTLLQRYNDLFVKQQYEVISKLFPLGLSHVLELVVKNKFSERIFMNRWSSVENVTLPFVIGVVNLGMALLIRALRRVI